MCDFPGSQKPDAFWRWQIWGELLLYSAELLLNCFSIQK